MRYFQRQSTVLSRSADGCVQDHVVTLSTSEGCSEQISTETQAVIPEEDTGVSYTLPNFETPDKDVDLVAVKRKLPSPEFMVEVILADINATIPSSETASRTPEETPAANSAPVDGSA
ncbi:PREDICTED: DNA polymerase eta-like [Camelina sativa]|uniref:DNA polymerase eta-like n=1 Tax=Camelina sativa TaxID=90675 RepID=A0ABM0UGV1_CAMSA|nr:PREDICTED: DNA polymerase eta-like [Camelina sativa]